MWNNHVVMRVNPGNPTSNRKPPTPPEKPKHRSMRVLAASRLVVPFFISGDQEVINNAIDAGKMDTLFADESVIAVGVGHLKLSAHLDYELGTGDVLEVAVNKVLWMFWAMGQLADPAVKDEDKPDITEVEGAITTPYGKMYGSLHRNIAELTAFIMSRYGQITGVKPDKTYEFIPITENEILDLLDSSSLMYIEDGADTPMFFEVIALAGLRPVTDVDVQDLAKEDDQKNLVSPINVEPSMTGLEPRGSSRRASKKATVT